MKQIIKVMNLLLIFLAILSITLCVYEENTCDTSIGINCVDFNITRLP